MSPIDDELRAVLTARAGQLQPSPHQLSEDVLPGVERRARRIRRNRIAVSVAGAALVISGLAVVVPALTPGGGTDRVTPPTMASQPPTPSPAVTSLPASAAPRPDNALDWPATPLADDGLDRGVRLVWAEQDGVDPADVQGEQLFMEKTPEGVSVGWYQLWQPGGSATAVMAHDNSEGPALLGRHQVTPQGGAPKLLVDVAPGADFPWIVALGAPTVSQLAYAEDGRTFVDLTPGRVAVVRRTGPTGSDMDLINATGPGVDETSTVGSLGGADEAGEPHSTDG